MVNRKQEARELEKKIELLERVRGMIIDEYDLLICSESLELAKKRYYKLTGNEYISHEKDYC